jgi:hypothetical protein
VLLCIPIYGFRIDVPHNPAVAKSSNAIPPSVSKTPTTGYAASASKPPSSTPKAQTDEATCATRTPSYGQVFLLLKLERMPSPGVESSLAHPRRQLFEWLGLKRVQAFLELKTSLGTTFCFPPSGSENATAEFG